MADINTRTCVGCNETKEADAFVGSRKRCILCRQKEDRARKREKRQDPEWRERNLEYQRKYYKERKRRAPNEIKNNNLRFKYGMTLDELQAMVVLQKGLCAICGLRFNPEVVDHDHITAQVRGLLCRKCNSGMGLLCDSPLLLQEAIRYLEGE